MTVKMGASRMKAMPLLAYDEAMKISVHFYFCHHCCALADEPCMDTEGQVKKTICSSRSFEVRRLDDAGKVLPGRAEWHGESGSVSQPDPLAHPQYVAQAQTPVIPTFISDQIKSAILRG